MEAKDTVIKLEGIQDLWIPCETCHRKPFWETGDSPIECMECIGLKHREAQAEISFKAGREEGFILSKVTDPVLSSLITVSLASINSSLLLPKA